MPRPLRLHWPGTLFHVITRGNNRQRIFAEPRDYDVLLKSLENTKRNYPFHLFAYALMPNHIHLLVQVCEAPTSRIMQSLLTSYTWFFHRKYGSVGHIFQGRYKAFLCDEDAYLLAAVQYIHLNPIRARLGDSPEAWRWSGHREYLNPEDRRRIDAGPVMELLKTPQQYAKFVHEGMGKLMDPNWDPGSPAPFLRGDSSEDSNRPQSRISPGREVVQPRAGLEELLAEFSRREGVSSEQIRSPSRVRSVVRSRDRFIQEAVSRLGHLPRNVARFLDLSPSVVTKALERARRDKPS